MNLKHLFQLGFFATCLLLLGPVLAQNKTVSGKVSDNKNGTPLAGVTVQVKGTNTLTTTSNNGTFIISVPEFKNILQFSNVEYENLEVDITKKTTVNVQLQSSSTSLNEVVVTGYTTQRKKDLTGSVAIVDVNSMKAQPAASVAEALQG